MALKYLENIVILFLQILMSLLGLLIHGAVTDEQNSSLSHRHKENSPGSDGVERQAKERNRVMNTPRSDLASLLDRWTTYQQAGKTIAGENVVIQQSPHIKPDAINTDKIEVQNKSSKCCNKNECSSKRRCIDSPLTKYNNRTQNGYSDTDCAGTQQPQECLAKATMASTEDILVSNAQSVSQRNKCANNKSSRLKHLDRTSSILSRIDNCLSKSKNTPLKHNLFPLHQINVKCLNKGVFMSDNDLAGFNCRAMEMADDTGAMLGILAKERDGSNSRTVQSRREMSLEDDTKVIGRGNSVDNEHSLVHELGITKLNQTFDKKDNNAINLLPEMPTFKRSSINDELATIEQTGHRSDEKKDLVETSVKIEEAVHKGCNKNARHCMEGNDIIYTDHSNQIQNTLSKGDAIEETNFKRTTGTQHINPVYTKEETNKASSSINTEKMAVRTNESINESNIGTTQNVTDIPTFPNTRQPDKMASLEYLPNLQRNNQFPKRENHRNQTMPRTSFLEDNAIVAVGIGGGNSDTGGAKAEVIKPGIDNLDGGIRGADGADNRDGRIRGAGGADNRDTVIRPGIVNLDGGIRGAGGADNRDGAIRGAGGADNRDGGIRGAGGADNRDGGKRGAGGADNRDGGIGGAGGADNLDGGIRGVGGADNRDGGIRGAGGADNRDGGIRGAGGADNRDSGIRGAGGADNRDGGIRGAGGADNRDGGIRGAGDTMSDNTGAAVPQKRIKHRWRKYGNPNENPNLVRDRMYAVRRRERRYDQ